MLNFTVVNYPVPIVPEVGPQRNPGPLTQAPFEYRNPEQPWHLRPVGQLPAHMTETHPQKLSDRSAGELFLREGTIRRSLRKPYFA